MIKKITEYQNLLENINLSVNDVENTIKNFKLSFFNIRNQKVEFGMKIPMFVYPFYNFILKEKKVPTQEEYWDFYIKENNNWFSENVKEKDIYDGLKARAYRTYPSIMRDFHFVKFVAEKAGFDKTIYNCELDVYKGIDLLIINKSRVFAVNLFTQTSRAIYARKLKENRHDKLDKTINNIEFPVDFKGSVKCGNFFLYGEEDMQKLLKLCA